MTLIDSIIATVEQWVEQIACTPHQSHNQTPSRAYLENNESEVRELGGLKTLVLSALIERAAPDAKGSQVIIRAKLDLMGKDLGIEKATPMEKLLIERVLFTWLYLHIAEQYSARALGSGYTFRESEQADKILSKAQHRYLKAVEALHKTRVLIKAEQALDERIELLRSKQPRKLKLAGRTLNLKTSGGS